MKNRQFKFRIWDTIDKKFSYLDLPPPFIGMSYFHYEPRQIYQQFVGLKDKNGKEIFEGDILRVNQYDHYNVKNEDLVIGYVNYCVDRCCYRLLGGLDTEIYQLDLHFLDNPIFYSKGISGSGRTYKIDQNKLEILGNIFENPDLLKL